MSNIKKGELVAVVPMRYKMYAVYNSKGENVSGGFYHRHDADAYCKRYNELMRTTNYYVDSFINTRKKILIPKYHLTNIEIPALEGVDLVKDTVDRIGSELRDKTIRQSASKKRFNIKNPVSNIQQPSDTKYIIGKDNDKFKHKNGIDAKGSVWFNETANHSMLYPVIGTSNKGNKYQGVHDYCMRKLKADGSLFTAKVSDNKENRLKVLITTSVKQRLRTSKVFAIAKTIYPSITKQDIKAMIKAELLINPPKFKSTKEFKEHQNKMSAII